MMAGTLTFREEIYAPGALVVTTQTWPLPDMSSRGHSKIALGALSGPYA